MTATSGPPSRRSSSATPTADDAGPASEDRELMARVAIGDAGALEELYGRYGRPCYGLARRILGDDVLAQDVVQEVFLVLWRDAGRYDARRGAFSSWLLSMTHHKAVDCVRREENLRKRHTAAEQLEAAEQPAPAPDDEVWGNLRSAQVRAALRDLPDPQREALVLAYFGGYTQREIAGLTSTPLGTVKTRMLAGMRRMRGGLDAVLTEVERAAPDGAA
jgi:RNA polymerase sigma factor (sigma-70 family)